MNPYNKYRGLVPPKTDKVEIKKPKIKAKLVSGIVVLFGVFFFFKLINVHAAAATQVIKSGVTGYCIDDYKGRVETNSKVDGWSCNDTSSQNWKFVNGTIRHGANSCLSVFNDAVSDNAATVLSQCSSAPGQVWLADQNGFQNPNSGKCLTFPGSNNGSQLTIEKCNLSNPNQVWKISGDGVTNCNALAKNEKIACFAEKEWSTWQASNSAHADLLNKYSDGNGYEEWCADFVSYIYKESGQPFNQGERDRWDEYDANNIQYMGFTKHDAGNYTPKTGDVAFFNYLDGHIEIVVSGGPKPTFIYGDSSNVDPATGNGNMEANTITSEGSYGQVTYYLSPN